MRQSGVESSARLGAMSLRTSAVSFFESDRVVLGGRHQDIERLSHRLFSLSGLKVSPSEHGSQIEKLLKFVCYQQEQPTIYLAE